MPVRLLPGALTPVPYSKHMRRHEKPYGCTFQQCSKRFGSKNDWNRHESTQHPELDIWHCDGQGCSKTYQQKESFKDHLQKDHGMGSAGDLDGAEDIDSALERCRMGRPCDARFWCGLCVRVLEIAVVDPGGNPWKTRSDHIEKHLFGRDGLRKMAISEWQQPGHEEAEHEEAEREEDEREEDENEEDEPPGAIVGASSSPAGSEAERQPLRPPKESSSADAFMWTCVSRRRSCPTEQALADLSRQCICAAMMNLKTSASCIECQHPRCSPNCAIERVSPNEQKLPVVHE